VPKPAAAKPAPKENKPESLNIPLPSGFNIGN